MIVLSHTGQTGYTAQAREAGARRPAPTVVHVTDIGKGGDVETVAPETSYAYTASHTGAHAPGPIAEALGADLGDLAAVPDAVARRARRAGTRDRGPPGRLLELIGAGPNAWTAPRVR